MPRFEPLPERRPAIVAGASSGIGAATAIELAAHGFPVALGARRVEKCQEHRRADQGRRRRGRSPCALDVTDPDSVKDCAERGRPPNSATSRCWSPAPATRTSASSHAISTDEFESQIQIHLIGANRARDGGAARHDQPPARRPHLRRVRRRAAPAPAHGRLRRCEGGACRDGDQPADGTRGHRCPGVDRASRADEDQHGLEPSCRTDRTGAGGLGQVGPGPPRLLPARRRISRGPSRSSPRRRAAASSRTWSSSPKRR